MSVGTPTRRVPPDFGCPPPAAAGAAVGALTATVGCAAAAGVGAEVGGALAVVAAGLAAAAAVGGAPALVGAVCGGAELTPHAASTLTPAPANKTCSAARRL